MQVLQSLPALPIRPTKLSTSRKSRIASLESRVNTHEFSFRAGVEVAEIAQTKGLEFDYVILLGIDEDSFLEDVDLSRHLLHIGLTRAAHQVRLVSWGRPANILPEDVKRISSITQIRHQHLQEAIHLSILLEQLNVRIRNGLPGRKNDEYSCNRESRGH